MPQKTVALVLKENNNIGEADRFVTLLSRDLGVVRASARGAQKIKSRFATATRMLTYSEVTLLEGKDKYVITDARPLKVFFGWKSIEGLTLAQYFCELALALCPREENAEQALRTLLNSLHFLLEGERDPLLIKAVTELRLLGGEGYMPDLSGCRRCGRQEGNMWLLPVEGTVRCTECGAPADNVALALPATVCSAMRGILHSPLEKCYGVRLEKRECEILATVTERLLLAQVNRSFQTLEAYHTMCRL